MQNPIRLVLAEDHAITMSGLLQMLAGHAEFEIIGLAQDAQQAMDLCQRLLPDVALLDLHLPGAIGTKSLIEKIAALPNVKILIFSAETRPLFIEAALAAGARGYIFKSELPRAIVHAITQVASGQTPVLSLRPSTFASAALTQSERHILTLLADGQKYEDIAQSRGSSPMTVKKQCQMLQFKLQLSSREELISWAAKNGFSSVYKQHDFASVKYR